MSRKFAKVTKILTNPGSFDGRKVTVCGDAPSVSAVKWLSIPQHIHAAVINKPDITPLDP